MSRFKLNFMRTATLVGLVCASLHIAAAEDDSKPIQAVWKPVEVRYSYVGFTTAYNCDAYETKLKEILRKIGAAPQTQVRATGCVGINRPSKNFFVTVTTATPVAAGEATSQLSPAEQELVERLGGDKTLSKDPFPATWKTVELSRDRKLDLEPGDCELMQGLQDKVLPKLSVKVLSNRIQCTPRHLDIATPELKVAALTPLTDPDKATAARD
ncbi:MAG: hypothetical protein ACREUC_04380 [Steroidobacteraceae bacterium]